MAACIGSKNCGIPNKKSTGTSGILHHISKSAILFDNLRVGTLMKHITLDLYI